jgi:hypothetical protein
MAQDIGDFTYSNLTYLLKMFLVDNIHYPQTNSSVHDINTRYKTQLHISLVRISAIQRSITYSVIKVFNKLLPSISRLKIISYFSSLI